MKKEKNLKLVSDRGGKVSPNKLSKRLSELEEENKRLKKTKSKALRRFRKDKEIKLYSAELIKLQETLEQEKRRMIILFEGRDAAGKGGAILRITHFMNERHYRVVALGRPTEEQRTQWFFQKYVVQFPRGGEILIFDRSWYNRAMVEPVFGFCTEEEHQNFVQGVAGFERDLVRQGTILIKIYFSVSQAEQAKRFEIRKVNPLKKWKLSEVDLQAQDRWDEFTQMKYQMLRYSHTTDSPWTIIRADNKHMARINAMKLILNSMDYAGRNEKLNYKPDADTMVSGSQELERMGAELIRQGKFSN
jgi:polyphosphate kinase 2